MNKIKQIKLNKHGIGRKEKVLGVIAFLILLVGFTYAILRAISGWFDAHTIKYNKVIEVILRKPIEITERKAEVKEIVKVINEIPNPVDLKTDTEKYIYEVFGIENYKLAIAIARSESNLNCSAVGINSNSADIGLFQINTLWLKNYSLEQLSSCKGNIDAAYDIWDRGDGKVGNDEGSWNPWVVWKTGAFRENYE